MIFSKVAYAAALVLLPSTQPIHAHVDHNHGSSFIKSDGTHHHQLRRRLGRVGPEDDVTSDTIITTSDGIDNTALLISADSTSSSDFVLLSVDSTTGAVDGMAKKMGEDLDNEEEEDGARVKSQTPQELLDEIIAELEIVFDGNQENTLNGALQSALNFLGKVRDADTNYTKIRKAIDASEALGCDPFEYTDSALFSICENISKIVGMLVSRFPQ